MKLEDLGINPETRQHNKRLTTVENRFLDILWTDFVGENNKISANELALRFDCAMQGFKLDPEQVPDIVKSMNNTWFDLKKRTVRHLHNHLLTMHDNISILSKAGVGGGYWIAESKQEAAEFYNTFRKRGMTGLVKASRGKKAILVDMMEQVTFEFENMAVNTGVLGTHDITGDPAAIAVVDSFLGRMLKNPEKFSEGLKKLSKKYGSVLLDKAEVAAMKAKATELSKLVESMGVV